VSWDTVTSHDTFSSGSVARCSSGENMQILSLDKVQFPLSLKLDITIAMEHTFENVESAKTFFLQMFHKEKEVTITTCPDYTDVELVVDSPVQLLTIAMWYAPAATIYNFHTEGDEPLSSFLKEMLDIQVSLEDELDERSINILLSDLEDK
jgi:hypothetical protein